MKQVEDQVCSLEYAKKLKESGVPQESLWYWSFWDGNFHKETPSIDKKGWFITEDKSRGYYSAFTVAELGEMLPDKFFSYRREDKGWQIGDKVDGWNWNVWVFGNNTEANARAKMLIYLLEKELVKL